MLPKRFTPTKPKVLLCQCKATWCVQAPKTSLLLLLIPRSPTNFFVAHVAHADQTLFFLFLSSTFLFVFWWGSLSPAVIPRTAMDLMPGFPTGSHTCELVGHPRVLYRPTPSRFPGG